MPLGVWPPLSHSSSGLAGAGGKTNGFYLFGIMQGEEHPFPATTQLNLIPYSRLPMLVSCMDCCRVTIDGAAVSLSASRGRCVFCVRYWLLQTHFALAFISLFFSSVIFIFAPRGVRHTKPLKAGRWLSPALTNDHYTSRPARRRIGAVMYRWFLRHFPRGGSMPIFIMH